MKKELLILIALLFLAGCTTKPSVIKDGTYSHVLPQELYEKRCYQVKEITQEAIGMAGVSFLLIGIPIVPSTTTTVCDVTIDRIIEVVGVGSINLADITVYRVPEPKDRGINVTVTGSLAVDYTDRKVIKVIVSYDKQSIQAGNVEDYTIYKV